MAERSPGSSSFNLGSDGANNVVQATGQTILLPQGKYSRLRFLGTATSGVESGTFTIHYTDGTSTTVTQLFSTWFTNHSEAGETVVKKMGYFNRGGQKYQQNVYLYGYSLVLNSTRTVLSVTLPSNSDIKILAMNVT